MRVACDATETLRAAVQNVGCRRFREEDEQDDQGETGEHEERPNGPSPSLSSERLAGETTDERTQNGTTDGRETPNTQSNGETFRVVQVTHRCSSCSEGRRSEESSEEAQNQKPGKVRNKRRRHLENDKNEQRDNVWEVAADHGDLGGSTESKHWSEAVANDEECQAKRSRNKSHAKLLSDEIDTRGIDGGAHVDTCGEEADQEGRKDLLLEGPVSRMLWVVGLEINQIRIRSVSILGRLLLVVCGDWLTASRNIILDGRAVA